MKKGQSQRLATQQKEREGQIGIFNDFAKAHDTEVLNISQKALNKLKLKYPKLRFRYRAELAKEEINRRLKALDPELGQTLFVKDAKIKPDGGIIEVLDDSENWRVVLVSEAKHQGKDIENIEKGILVGKNNNQDLMVAGNAIERSHKNICEIANYMLGEKYFPYIVFLTGSNFLTQTQCIARPDGRVVTLPYNSGTLNRLDRLTAANYGMPINTNLCRNKFIRVDDISVMLQAASLYTSSDGRKWTEEKMLSIMLEVAQTSLQCLGEDLFRQLTQNEKD